MATTSTRIITLGLSDTVNTNTNQYAAAANGNSPGQSDLVTLASGANTITKPSGGSTVVGITIVPPVGNTSLITLKGVSGDTGVPLHKTDPSSFGVDSTLTTLVLTAAAEIQGVRITWT